MPTFRYSAYRAGGEAADGTIDAPSLRDAVTRLKQEGLHPREISALGAPPRGGLFGRLRRRVPVADLALLTRRLAILVGAAVPVHEAVATLWEQERPGELKQACGRIRERIAEGAGLARALETESQLFGESYVTMVAAGEASGALDVVLQRLADFLESQEAIRSRIVTALAYPTLMVAVGCGVMGFLLSFVVPRIVMVFEDNRATLPFITLALIAVSRFLQRWWWLLLTAPAMGAPLLQRLLRRESVRQRRDSLILRLPFVGKLVHGLNLARLARTLGLLLASGVPLLRALEITRAVLVNREFAAGLRQVEQDVTQGGALAASLGRHPLFPPLLLHLVAVGEKGGDLEGMLTKAGVAYEREFDTAIGRGMALLEPLLVLGMGLAVGIVVIAVLLPIFEMNQLIR